MPTTSVTEKSEVANPVARAAEVFHENGTLIRSIIRFHVKSEVEAEDLFQDLFLFLISKPIPEEVQNVKSFLYKLISDMVKTSVRRVERYQTRINTYVKRKAGYIKNRPEAPLMEVEETKKMFEFVERRLSPKEAMAVTLRYKDDCNTDEVAEKMGVKPRSVYRYVSLGLKKIRSFFAEEQENNHGNR
jgi:RNA polymerase sigma factor (sigma-70 family)